MKNYLAKNTEHMGQWQRYWENTRHVLGDCPWLLTGPQWVSQMSSTCGLQVSSIQSWEHRLGLTIPLAFYIWVYITISEKPMLIHLKCLFPGFRTKLGFNKATLPKVSEAGDNWGVLHQSQSPGISEKYLHLLLSRTPDKYFLMLWRNHFSLVVAHWCSQEFYIRHYKNFEMLLWKFYSALRDPEGNYSFLF